MPDETVQFETKRHGSIYFTLGSLLTLGIWPFMTRRTSEYAVTNKRVIAKEGWLSRRTVEMNLPRIESLAVQQGMGGRMLGYGTVDVIGTGGTRERFSRIGAPLEFRRAVQEAQAASPAQSSA